MVTTIFRHVNRGKKIKWSHISSYR